MGHPGRAPVDRAKYPGHDVVTFDLLGAQGGALRSGANSALGGRGAEVLALVDVAPRNLIRDRRRGAGRRQAAPAASTAAAGSRRQGTLPRCSPVAAVGRPMCGSAAPRSLSRVLVAGGGGGARGRRRGGRGPPRWWRERRNVGAQLGHAGGRARHEPLGRRRRQSAGGSGTGGAVARPRRRRREPPARRCRWRRRRRRLLRRRRGRQRRDRRRRRRWRRWLELLSDQALIDARQRDGQRRRARGRRVRAGDGQRTVGRRLSWPAGHDRSPWPAASHVERPATT